MKPSAELQEEYLGELLEKERSIAKKKEKKKSLAKAIGGEIADLEERRDQLLDLLEGREHDQANLPLRTPSGPGVILSAAANGAAIPADEVKFAREELQRRKRARNVTIEQKALPPARKKAKHGEVEEAGE